MPQNNPLQLDGLAWAGLITLAVMWGSAFIFVEVLLTALPVLTIVALRLVLAAAVLWVIALSLGMAPPRRARTWAYLAALGVLNNALPFVLITSGQTMTTGGLAAVLISMTPILTALLAALALPDEKLTTQRLGGLALGVAGVTAVIGPDLTHMGAATWGPLAVLGGACSYAAGAVFARAFRIEGLSPLAIAAGQTTTGGLILTPLALILDRPFALPVPGPWIWITVAATALFSTALAYVLFFAVLRRAGATNATLVAILIPVVAVIIGTITLSEAVSLRQLSGMALIALGLAVIDGIALRPLRRASLPRTRRQP